VQCITWYTSNRNGVYVTDENDRRQCIPGHLFEDCGGQTGHQGQNWRTEQTRISRTRVRLGRVFVLHEYFEQNHGKLLFFAPSTYLTILLSNLSSKTLNYGGGSRGGGISNFQPLLSDTRQYIWSFNVFASHLKLLHIPTTVLLYFI